MSDIFQRLQDLSVCLCAQLEIDGSSTLCFCGVTPGEQVAHEYMGDCDDCSMAWVRVSAIYPASGVGQINIAPGNCQSLTGVDIEMGIARCNPVGGPDGSPPTQEELLAAAEQQIKDAMTMWRAIICCQGEEADWIIGQYQPFGPDGGTVGGTIEINFLEQ